MSIHKKILKATMEFDHVKKNKEGYGYKYADLSNVITSITDQLNKNGMYITVEMNDNVVIAKCVDSEDGTFISSSVKIPEGTILSGKTNVMQDLGAAITYARRYALVNLFNIAVEDDDAKSLTQKKKEIKASQPSGGRGPSEAQLKRLYAIQKSSGWSDGDVGKMLVSLDTATREGLSIENYNKLCAYIEEHPRPG